MTRDDEALQKSESKWSIERGLVVRNVAEAAGLEILGAIATKHPMLSFDHDQPNNGYTGYIINGWEDLKKRELKKPDFALGSLWIVRKALADYRDPNLIKQGPIGHYDMGFVNVMEPGGKIPKHFDNEPWSLAFVNLRKKVQVRLWDNKKSKPSIEILRPGDVLEIVNSIAKRKRLQHKLVNISKGVRVSYGEYTAPS